MRLRARFPAAGGVVVLAVLGGGLVAPAADEHVAAEVVTSFRDSDIDESSGLVVRGRTLYTVNDSGDGASVYAVDARTGETVAVSDYGTGEAVDVEALAPGRGGALWVGDIGDNSRARGSVSVHRLVPSAGDVESTRFELAYPDHPRDAETLLVHPQSGRLFVVTKQLLLGGVVYRAPERLEPGALHRLEKVAAVPGLVTDGTFFPDGRHVLLRTYDSAAIYTFPGFEEVAAFDLPEQEQGEAISIGPPAGPGRGPRVYVSSEGEHAEVLALDLPAAARRAVRPPAASEDGSEDGSAGGSAGDGGPPGKGDDPASTDRRSGAGDGVVLGRPLGYAVAAVAGALVVGLLLRASRRRSRRRR